MEESGLTNPNSNKSKRSKIQKIILVWVGILVLLGSVSGFSQDTSTYYAQNHWFLSVETNFYRSFSQKKNSLPMIIGYPMFKATAPRIETGYNWFKGKKEQQLSVNFLYSCYLNADDGLDNNYITRPNQSHHLSLLLNHKLLISLVDNQRFELVLGGLTGIDIQQKQWTYKSDFNTQTSDVNLYIGPDTRFLFRHQDQLSFKIEFGAAFYLPYFNIGKIKHSNPENELIYESPYRAFYYRTVFEGSMSYEIKPTKSLELGYKKDDTVGFANTAPLFYVDEMVHYRLDRIHRIFLKYWF